MRGLVFDFTPLSMWTTSAADHVERRISWYLALLTFAYAFIVVLWAAEKPFWYDELFTVYLSRLETFEALWTALKDGVDLNPPFLYLTVKWSQAVFGENHVGTRVPMMIGFWLMSLGLYLFLRQRTPATFALVGALFPFATNAFSYAFEARSYGIVLGGAGLALACWQRAGNLSRRKFWLAGLGLSLGLALLTHCYAVLLLFPFFLGEVARTLNDKRVDWPIWLCLGVASLPVVLYPTLLAAGRPQIDLTPSYVPGLSVVPDFYRYALHPTIPGIAFTVLVGAVLTLWNRSVGVCT